MIQSALTKHRLTVPFVLILILIVCLSVWGITGNLPQTTVWSGNGVWDLRGVDFNDTCIELDGAVEYVTGRLLAPDGFAEAEGRQVGQIPSQAACLTSRVTLLVPEGRFFEVAGFVDDFGSRIFVNGKWLTDSGMPSENPAENIPSERYLRFTAEPENGVIEIVQQTSNFVFRSNTGHNGWLVGYPEMMERRTTGFLAAYTVNIGFYLALFLVHLLLFVLLPSYRTNLWFALLCMIWALRTGITRVRPLVVLLQIGWEPALRLEYLTAVAALALLTLSYSTIFPGVLHKKLCMGIYGFAGACGVLYLTAGTLFISRTMFWFEVVAGAWALYVIVRIVTKLRGLDAKQKIIVAGLGLFLAALILDTLFYNGIHLSFMHNVILETALLIFSLFQMTAMFLGTMEEVSAAEEAEQRLTLENAALERVSRLKTDLMATISHEMRTPLAVMMGFAQLTAAELQDKGVDAQATADLDAIAAEAQRLARMVEEMQRMSLAGQWEEKAPRASVEAVIRQITRLYRPILERRQIMLTETTQGGLPPVTCGENELTQILFNLINNADKHGKGGTIRVATEREGDMVAVAVTDTGMGVAPELLPHVFERYRHGENGGTGLGLSICREIVEGCGGQITMESALGRGTTVRFALPVAGEDGAEA